MSEYRNFNQSLETERKKIETARDITKDVQLLVTLKAAWDEGFPFLSSAFKHIEARYEKDREQKKQALEKIKSEYGNIENRINQVKIDNDRQQHAYGKCFSRLEDVKKKLKELEQKASHYKLFPSVEACGQQIVLLEAKRDRMVLELGKSTVDTVERIEQKIKSVQREIAGFESQLKNITSNLLFVLKKHFSAADIQTLMKMINKDIFISFSVDTPDLHIQDEAGLIQQLNLLLLRCENGVYTDGNIRVDLNRIAPVDIADYFNHDQIKTNLDHAKKDETELLQTLNVARNYQQKEREKSALDQTIREQTNDLEGYKSFLTDKDRKPEFERQFSDTADALNRVMEKKKSNDAQIDALNKRIIGDKFEIEQQQAALQQMEADRQRVTIVKDLEGNTAFAGADCQDTDDIKIDRLIRDYVLKSQDLSDIKSRIYQCFSNIELRGGNRFSSGKDIPARIKEFEDSTSEETIENYERVLRRNETAATRQLGAMLKNLRDQFYSFEYEIKRFNREMNKHQISNIRKIEFIVDENNHILSIIKTLINEDSIFGGDKDIFRVVERFNELIDKKGVKISLPNLFNLGIAVQLENGKEIKSFGNTSIQSTGTDLTVKVVVNVMLLSRILHVKHNQILNIPAYIDEAGQIDPVNQQTLIDQCAKAGFVHWERSGRGGIYTLKHPEAVKTLLAATGYHGSTESLTSKARAVARHKDAHKGRDDTLLILLSATKEVMWQNNGRSINIHQIVQDCGIAAILVKPGDNWVTQDPIALVENMDLLVYAVRYFETIHFQGSILYYSGWVSRRTLAWLNKQKNTPLVIFPDYDLVGLKNYLLLKETLPHIKIYVPENLPDLLKRYGKADKLTSSTDRKIIEQTQDADALKLYRLLLKYGVGLDQESLMLMD
ncbi:hypothetical protein [Desulfobacula sp.]|uniref:hypothetical protein n=1 Tax=Desulfobacula sp. TaxID=2593537 RepID=UPI00261D0F22|nr:hypothetical protein [Desulfobacula sp.]